MKRVTISAVRASQDIGSRRLPILFWFGTRIISWPVTLAFSHMGCSPTTAGIVRLFIALVAFAFVASASTAGFFIGIGLFYFTLVLDHVDGSLARLSERTSFYGKYIDGLIDSIQEIPLPAFLGFHLYVTEGGVSGVLAGAAASILMALAQTAMIRYGLVKGALDLHNSQGKTTSRWSHDRLDRWLKRYAFVVRIFDSHYPNLIWDIRYGGLIIALVFAELLLFLEILIVANAILLVGLVVVRFLRGAVELDIYRRSQTAPPLS